MPATGGAERQAEQPVTQIANLQQIDGTRTSFMITKNAIFAYALVFPSPLGPQVPLVAAATMNGTSTLSNLPAATVASLVTGQPVSGYGVPDGTTIAGIPSATSVLLSQATTQSGAAVGVTFQVLPLDITGIDFRQQIRSSAGDPQPMLDISTANGLLVSGGPSGTLAASVQPDLMAALPLTSEAGPLVTDIVASAPDGGPVNLMALSGPASVTVLSGVTR